MKRKTKYGFPLSYVLFRLVLILVILLILFMLLMLSFPFYFILVVSITILLIYAYFGIILFKKDFLKKRSMVLEQMIKLADLNNNTTVLDLGTGSGFLAIGFAKKIQSGKSIGLDRYNLKNDKLKARFISYIKTNFIQNTLKNAKENAKIENVENKCRFIQADIKNPLKFEDKYFDIVVSSQLFYCIPKEKRDPVFKEVDRVLKKNGKIIFFESYSFMDWNINDAKSYFENRGYKIEVKQSDQFKTCCILSGIKL